MVQRAEMQRRARRQLGRCHMVSAAKLSEFVAAQDAVYDQVVSELKSGRKRTHWIWFIFPQIAGLGFSHMSQKFALSSVEDAREYLRHDVLGPRLVECARLVLSHAPADVGSILGYPDDLKFCSCMTLFAAAAPEASLFNEALQAFFKGERDPRTIALLQNSPES